MKTKLSLILTLLSASLLSSHAQISSGINLTNITNGWVWVATTNEHPDAIIRTVTVSNETYTVIYRYNAHGCYMTPLTFPPGQPHYSCMVEVYRNGQQIGKAFDGMVTPKGCFEDNPTDMVALAWATVPPPPQPRTVCINSIDADTATLLDWLNHPWTPWSKPERFDKDVFEFHFIQWRTNVVTGECESRYADPTNQKS
jgi:hypothetical protein